MFTYQQASTAPYASIQPNANLTAMFSSAMQGGGTGVTDMLSAGGLQMPAPAINRIQQEMRNYGRVAANRVGAGYEINRGAADAAQQLNAQQAQSNAALNALGFNQNSLQNYYTNQAQNQSSLMRMLSPFYQSMFSQAGL